MKLISSETVTKNASKQCLWGAYTIRDEVGTEALYRRNFSYRNFQYNNATQEDIYLIIYKYFCINI